MSNKQSLDVVRIQLDLPEHKLEELNELMKEANIGNRKDLFNTALTLLAWVVAQRKENRIITSLNEEEGSYIELKLPFVDDPVRSIDVNHTPT